MRQCAGEVIQRTIATRQRTFHLPTDPSRPRACNSLIQTRKLAHEDKIFELLGVCPRIQKNRGESGEANPRSQSFLLVDAADDAHIDT